MDASYELLVWKRTCANRQRVIPGGARDVARNSKGNCSLEALAGSCPHGCYVLARPRDFPLTGRSAINIQQYRTLPTTKRAFILKTDLFIRLDLQYGSLRPAALLSP